MPELRNSIKVCIRNLNEPAISVDSRNSYCVILANDQDEVEV